MTCRTVHEHIEKVTYGKVILGILEAERFLGEEMKLKVSKEYFRRLKKVLKSKFNGGKISSRSQYLGSISFKIFSSIY